MMKITLLNGDYAQFANSWLLLDEESGEAAIVDPGSYSGEILQVAEKYNIKFVLLTHGHFDHILGAPQIRDTGAKVYISPRDEKMLSDPSLSLSYMLERDDLRQVVADELIDEGDTVMLGNTPISVISTPGHTPGSLCFIVESERTILSGDTLFCMTVGRTDFAGGSSDDMISSVKRLISLEGDYRVLPGHNRETTLDNERRRNIFVRHYVKD